MLRDFSLPTYREIPAVGLYLDQTSKYINEVLQELPDCNITNSMISNYVKHHLITNPVKKQYSRDQIACLIFIAVTKNTLSLDEVAAVFEMQKGVCEIQDAYVRFSEIFESYLHEDSQMVCGRVIRAFEKTYPRSRSAIRSTVLPLEARF